MPRRQRPFLFFLPSPLLDSRRDGRMRPPSRHPRAQGGAAARCHHFGNSSNTFTPSPSRDAHLKCSMSRSRPSSIISSSQWD